MDINWLSQVSVSTGKAVPGGLVGTGQEGLWVPSRRWGARQRQGEDSLDIIMSKRYTEVLTFLYL